MFNQNIKNIKIPESHDTHFVDDVKFSGPIEIENRLERSRMSVEKIFVVDQRVRIAKVLTRLIKCEI